MLLMRLAMQAQTMAPSLAWLVVELLDTLLGKAVWADKNLWRGWLLAAQRNTPAAFPLFLQARHAAPDVRGSVFGACDSKPPAAVPCTLASACML